MIYGICAISFNVIMSYDCMPYMSQVLVDRTPYHMVPHVVVPPTNLFSFIFWHISYLSVFPYIFQAKYVGNKKINENKLVGGTTTWGTIWGPVYEHLCYMCLAVLYVLTTGARCVRKNPPKKLYNTIVCLVTLKIGKTIPKKSTGYQIYFLIIFILRTD